MQSQSDQKDVFKPTQEPRLSLATNSVFAQNVRKAPLKIKATPGLLTKINSSKKFGGPTQHTSNLNVNRPSGPFVMESNS